MSLNDHSTRLWPLTVAFLSNYRKLHTRPSQSTLLMRYSREQIFIHDLLLPTTDAAEYVSPSPL
jgi:hypothetical protein